MSNLAPKNPVGRPVRYSIEIAQKAIEYLNTYTELDDKIPSIAGLSQAIDVNRTLLYKWASDEDKPELKDILDKIVCAQERVLLNNGLSGAFNSNITKLVLGKHGYHDKQELTGQVTVSKVERSIIDVTPESALITDN